MNVDIYSRLIIVYYDPNNIEHLMYRHCDTKDYRVKEMWLPEVKYFNYILHVKRTSVKVYIIFIPLKFLRILLGSTFYFVVRVKKEKGVNSISTVKYLYQK